MHLVKRFLYSVSDLCYLYISVIYYSVIYRLHICLSLGLLVITSQFNVFFACFVCEINIIHTFSGYRVDTDEKLIKINQKQSFVQSDILVYMYVCIYDHLNLKISVCYVSWHKVECFKMIT